jgi:uncharacterized integral membrane protein (TIGR00697 family)
MFNEIIFIIHTLIIVILSISALRLGCQALVATLSLFSVLSNMFIAKQIMFFGFSVTCCDVYAVGSILCLNILQEFFGKKNAFRAILTSFFCLIIFLLMSQLHLWYLQNTFDTTQHHYQAILSIMPRITAASIFSYLVVQILDTHIFSLLKKICAGRLFTLRTSLSLVFSQTLDTVLFSVLGLYGNVASITHVIIVSLAIKLLIIAMSTPLIGIAKNVMRDKQ